MSTAVQIPSPPDGSGIVAQPSGAPPPPDGSGIVAQPSGAIPPPPDGSGIVAQSTQQPQTTQPGFLDRLGVGGILDSVKQAMASGVQAHEAASKQFDNGDYAGAFKTLGKALVIDPVTAELKNTGAGYVYHATKGFVNSAQDVAHGNYGQGFTDLVHTASPFPSAVAEDTVNQNYPGLAGDAVLAATAALGAKASLAEGGAAPEIAEATPKAGPLRQIWQGEKVAQAPAKAALQGGAQASAADAGVAGTADTAGSVRTLLDNPIDALSKNERAAYDTINKAAGTDLKALYDYRTQLQDALDDPTNIGQKANLQSELKTTEGQIADGEKLATSNGVDPDTLNQAKGMTQQRYAMEDVAKKLFSNESVVRGNMAHGAPETINIDSALRQVENLDKPSRFAPRGAPTRLEQAFGEDGAQALKQSLYDAQKAGQTALTKQVWAKRIASVTGAASATYEALKGIFR